MKNSDIENRIKSSFAEETPDVLPGIMARIDAEDGIEDDFAARMAFFGQRKRKGAAILRLSSLVASLLIVFIVGVFVGNLLKINQTPNAQNGALASVYIDVNPSIKISVDGDERVKDCVAGNEDAEDIVGDMNLIGTDIKTALNAIIGSMYMNGYLTSGTNSMLVSVDANDEKFSGLLTNIVKNVNDIVQKSGITCSIVAQDVTKEQSIEELAKENSVSIGKMSLVNKIIDGLDDYSDEDRAALSKIAIKDLNALYAFMKESQRENEDVEPEMPDKPDEKPDVPNDKDGENDEIDKSDGDKPDGEGGKNPSGDIISGVLDAFNSDKEDALELALKFLSAQLGAEVRAETISNLSVKAKYVTLRDGFDFEVRFVYEISFTHSEHRYEYIVSLENEGVTEKGEPGWNGDVEHGVHVENNNGDRNPPSDEHGGGDFPEHPEHNPND